MKTLSETRYAFAPLVTTSKGIIDGLITHQENLGVTYSTLEKFNLALTALCGSDGASGSEGLYNLAASTVKEKSALLTLAVRNGRTVARSAVNVLKNTLGNEFSPAWQAVGFTSSLAIPKDPGPVLILMSAYLTAHPEIEFAAQNVTGVKLREAVQNMDNARREKTEAMNLAKAAMDKRDLDREALYQLMLALRRELLILLSADDPRWYAFGFRRPIDGRIPVPVADLSANPLAAGTVELTWTASTRAGEYRVQWYAAATPEEVISAGLTKETTITLHNLPSGVPIVVLVSAYNKSGETQPTTMEVTAP